MAIPEECEYIRMGFKITGSGKAEVQTIKIGELRERVNNLVGKSDTLVLAKQYPAYDDLYKYGFLHTRLKAYKHEGVLTDMFKFSNNESAFGFSEFESIDLFEGNADSLREVLSSGQFKKVLVHLIDHHMWNVLREFSKELEIYIWVHGAEIQTWQRREFEFELMDKAQVERQKRLSDQRRRFWQKMLDNDINENIHFIFVSQYFLEESEEGLDRNFPEKQVSIIHNYIDSNAFPYQPKNVEQRYNLLSIRPYASRKYANDMTINAILELSKSAEFNKFKIALYGDGELFDGLVEPLRKFDNVSLYKKFLNHAQISALHKEYGVFLTPTRMDSQGVSRDEAMSSGLVPVTTAVTAIPEFVDDKCSILVAGEDYKAMADGVLSLVNNPDSFAKLSLGAADRVRKQCGYENTIKKELNLFIRKEV
jgi:glycosyltransferase involved in cell wall biosynthesis